MNPGGWSWTTLRLPVVAGLSTALGAICLGPVFQTGAWFIPSVFAIVLVIGACELTRRTSVSEVFVPVAGLAALTVYLVLRYARGEASLGLFPDLSSIQRLAEMVRTGNQDISRFAAPVGLSHEFELIAVGGIGLVALAVDALAVTLRRATLAGIPLILLYSVPTAVAPDGVSWQAFTLGAGGYLALLLVESRERVSRWGRPVRFSPRTEWDDAETAPLAQVGRRVGAAALGLALVVPAVLPDIGTGSWGFGGAGFGRGHGVGNRVAVINPIIDLGKNLRQGSDRPVIRYSGPNTYLRLVSLDQFDGTSWQPRKLRVPKEQTVDKGLPRPAGLASDVSQKPLKYSVQVLGLDERWLPLPYPTQKVKIDGRWVFDKSSFNVFSTNSSSRDKKYQVTSLNVAPTAAQLRAATTSTSSSLARYLALPRDLPALVQQTATSVTKGAATDFDKALTLQNWLRDPEVFTYSVNAPASVGDGNGSTALVAFLQAKAGYCVHFASAMAVMARTLGIPARVSVGFTGGNRDRDGRYVVGLHEAHSWPELYFEGTGWVAFEPTPAVRTGNPPAYASPESAIVPPVGAIPTTEPSTTSSAGPKPNDNNRAGREAQNLGPNSAQSLRQRLQLPLIPTLLVLALVLLALVPWSTRALVRRRRWAGADSPEATVQAAWDELHDTMLDYGCASRTSDSPRAQVARLAEDEFRDQADEGSASGEVGGGRAEDGPLAAAHRLGAATERARYAPALGDVGDVRADVATVAAALAAGSSRRRRLRARLLPRSTRAVAAALSERLADGLDALDSAAARARGQLTQRVRARRSPT